MNLSITLLIENVRKRPLLFSIILLGIANLVISSCFGFRYESNDDIWLEWSYSGQINGKVCADSLFNNYLFGILVSSLYNLTIQVNWFGLILILILNLSILWLSYNISKLDNLNLHIFINIMLVGIIYIKFATRLNWTNVAFIAGFSGVLALLLNKDASKYELVISYILVFFSIIIRLDMFLMVIMLFFLYIIKIFLKERKRIFCRFSIIILIGLLSYLIDFMHYKNHEWTAYKKTYKLLARIGDNPSFNESIINKYSNNNDWTVNDVRLFKNFFFDLPGQFKDEKIKSLLKNTKPIRKKFYSFISEFNSIFSVKILLFFIVFSLVQFGRNTFIINVLSFFFTFIVFYYLSGTKEIFKQRIIFPISFFYFVITLVFNDGSTRQLSFGKWKNYIISIFYLYIISLVFLNYVIPKSRVIEDEKLINFLSKKKFKILDFYCILPVHNFNLLRTSISQMKDIKYMPTGWINLTPIAKDYYITNGLGSLHEAIYDEATLIMVPDYLKETFVDQMSHYYDQYMHNYKFEFAEKDHFQNIVVFKINIRRN